MLGTRLENHGSIVGPLQLVLAGLFHAALSIGIFGVPADFFGRRLDLGVVFFFGIAVIYLFLFLLNGLAEYKGRIRAAALCGLVASVIFFPVYIAGFARVWQLGLGGLVYSWVLSHRYMRRIGRNQVDDTGNASRARHVPLVEDLSERDRNTADFVVFNSLFAAFLILNEVGYGTVASTVSFVAVWCFIGILGGISLVFEYRHARMYEKRFPLVRGLLILAIVAVAVFDAGSVWVVCLLGVRQLVAGLTIWWHTRGGRDTWLFLVNRPASLLAISFAAAIMVGTLLLTLPGATVARGGLNALDALFTATSATCVTGLIVVDTGSVLSLFGQWVVLALIQVGGLGIMTISIFIALLLGRSMGLRGEFALKETIGEGRTRTALKLVMFIVCATLILELIGSVVLFIGWHELDGSMLHRVHVAVFHSVSAFCNAGFSLFSDSLCGFNDTPLIALTVSILIILGGLGFSVLYVCVFYAAQVRNNIHVRLVLLMSGLLLVLGMTAFWLVECGRGQWDGGSAESWLNAWFQSVTTRTAGFNTVDLSSLSHATLIVMMILMFIGAAPGSTAGGIKITTAAVLLLTVRAVLTGNENVNVSFRRISQLTVMNAATLLCLSLFAVGLATVGLILTHDMSPGVLLFEAFSAFGTVGLSIGATEELNAAGKLIIICLMFVGRTGPLTLLVIMRPRVKSKCQYPSADVMVG